MTTATGASGLRGFDLSAALQAGDVSGKRDEMKGDKFGGFAESKALKE